MTLKRFAFSAGLLGVPIMALAASAAPSLAPGPFQAEWKALVTAAQKEGSLSFALAGGAALDQAPWYREFGKQFGIKITLNTGGSRQIGDKALAEKRAGRLTIDLFVTGGGTMQRMYEAGVAEPIKPLLIRPDVLDTSRWRGKRHYWQDPKESYLFLFGVQQRAGGTVRYNPKLVDARKLNSIDDLLDPRWRGRIADVNVPYDPASMTALAEDYGNPRVRKWMERLWTEQKIVIIPDIATYVDSIIRGSVLLGIGAGGGTVTPQVRKAKELGLPIDEKDLGGYVRWLVPSSGGIVKLAGGPHPNAAKLFINWAASRDGWLIREKLVQNGAFLPRVDEMVSLRVDVPNAHVPPEWRIPNDSSFYLFQADPRQVERTREAADHFKRLLKEAGY
jgi:iron(III) transport system substrate-binding protein